MRRVLSFLFLIFSLASVGICQTRPRTTHRPAAPTTEQRQQFADDQEAINALHNDNIKGSMSLNADELESLWTDDIVTISPGGPPVVGRDANRAKIEQISAQLQSVEILAYDEQFQEVRIDGDVALEYGTITERTRPFKGGEESNSKLNVMRVLRRQPDGSWKIARAMYNDATGAPQKPAEPPKPPESDKNKLKD